MPPIGRNYTSSRGAVSLWLYSWLSRGTPAIRIAISLSLAIHIVGFGGLLIAPSRTGQLSDTDSAGIVQTVIALDSPPPLPPIPETPTETSTQPEPEPLPEPLPTPEPEPAPVVPPTPNPFTPTVPSEVPLAPVAHPTTTSNHPSRTARPPADSPAPPTPSKPRVITFAGVNAQRAKSIVYVLDASGPMVTHWDWSIEQLRLSLSLLDDTQSFQVFITRLLPAPADGSASMRRTEVLSFSTSSTVTLSRATPDAVADAAVWLKRQQVRGAADPLAGLSRALSLKPDLILLLSCSFDQNAGAATRSNADVLAELDRLNPRGAGSQRPVVIKTIQLGSDDPTGLLQAIAMQHGDGPGSYHIVPPAELEKTTAPK